MAVISNWYLVPSTGTGSATSPNSPKYDDMFTGLASKKVDPKKFLVRYNGTESSHEEPSTFEDVGKLTESEVEDTLKRITGQQLDIDGWNANRTTDESAIDYSWK